MAAPASPDPLEQFLTYNPWEFRLENPARDLAYVAIGMGLYECIDCLTILNEAKAKWKSQIYLGLCVALLFGATSVILAFIFQTSPLKAGDAFAGHVEVNLAVVGTLCVLFARLAYYYVTLRMTLAVCQGVNHVRYLCYAISLIAAVGHIWYSSCLIHFFEMQLDEYKGYMNDHDVNAIFGRIMAEIVPYLADIQRSQSFQGITTFLFIILTKIPFLWEIFTKLRVPPKEAFKTMIKMQSTRRIFYCCAWSITEVVLMDVMPVSGLAFCVAVYSTIFQITTMAMLAFHGSVAIIQEHSMANRGSKAKSINSPPSQATNSITRTAQSSGDNLRQKS